MMKKEELPILFSLICESNLDDIVKALQSMKNDSTNYYYDFLGCRLYSDTVTLDSAYEEVYKMSRQEYRKKIIELYKNYKTQKQEIIENTKKEMSEKKARIYEQARKVIAEDQMPIFTEVLDILAPHGFLNEEHVQIYLKLLEELNKDNYSLDIAKPLYDRIQPTHVLDNCILLKSIKQLSVHGKILFDELYDEESEIRARNAQKRMTSFTTQGIITGNIQEPTEDELITNFDRKVITKCLASYNLGKRKIENTSNR